MAFAVSGMVKKKKKRDYIEATQVTLKFISWNKNFTQNKQISQLTFVCKQSGSPKWLCFIKKKPEGLPKIMFE